MLALRCFLIGLAITAFTGIPHVFSQEEMPKGFGDIHLGMKLDVLLSARTDAKPFGFFQSFSPVTNQTNQMYVERIKEHPFFDHIMYSFQTNQLDTVVFFGRVSGTESNNGKRFLNDLLSEWGAPDQYEVVELDEGKGSSKAPAAIWRRKALLIAASFTPDERSKATGRGSLQLKIQKDQGGMLDKVFVVPSISQKEKDAILVPVRSAVAEWRTSHPEIEIRDQPKQE